MPEMNTLKQAQTPAAKLYNWNILSQALELVGIVLDPDTKSLIIAGDTDMIIEVLKQIYNAENIRTSSNASKRGHKPMQATDGGIIIENISENKKLEEAESCLEYLILSFCHNFLLKPKQGAGLLAQGCKFLAHIVVKGLKGDFEPVKSWLQEIYGSLEVLTELILKEKKAGSLRFILTALKPGLLSKDTDVVQWSFDVLSRLALDLSYKDSLADVWDWFISDSVLELCLVSLRRQGISVYKSALDMLLQIGQNRYLDLFGNQLSSLVTDTKEYVNILSEFLPHMTESESIYDEISVSGILEFWIEFCIKEIDSVTGKSIDTRIAVLGFVYSILNNFFVKVNDNENSMNSILGIINRTCRDENTMMRTISIGLMFQLFDLLANKKSPFAPIVYRTLTFLLVESYNISNTREYIAYNFSLIFKSNPNIPIGILLEPFVKRLQVSEISLELFDYDFLLVLSQYPKLSIKHSIQLIDVIGKLYLNEFIYSKASGVVYTYIASKHIHKEAMQEYLLMFTRYSLNLVLSTEQLMLQTPNAKQKTSVSDSVQQRIKILDMVSWIVQQWEDSLNSKIKDLLLSTNYAYYQIAQKDCKSILVVLSLFGNAQDILIEFRINNPKLFSIDPIQEDNNESILDKQLVLVTSSNTQSKPLLPKRKNHFPWERAAEDIEKAKKKKIEKDNKIKEDENKKIKALEFKKKKIKQQLEIRKLEQGVGSTASIVYDEGLAQKLVVMPDEIQLREFNSGENDLLEAVRLMLNKYSRVFKVMFNKYSGTGFARKVQSKSDFDLHAERKSKITDGEYIKIMKDHDVVSNLITKEELRMIMRAYNHKIAKQAEQGYVDYEGFKGVFCQLAYFIYSKKSHDYSHLPPVVSVKLLLEYMRNSLYSKNFSTEIFDEPDPGTGDKDVVRSLNKLLSKDPNTNIPDGYKKIADKDLLILFVVPSCLNLPQSYVNCIEILDSIFNSIGIHILEPQVQYINTYRAKGIAPKEKSLPPSIEKLENVSREKIKNNLSTNSIKLSPTIKFHVAHAPSEDKEVYEEVSLLLEDVLRSVQLKMKRLINRAPKVGAQEEKFEQKKEKERKDEEMKKIEEDKKRKIRQQQLLDELNKAKEERQNKLKQDEEKKKYEKFIEEQKKKELEEKIKKDKIEKQKILKEWAEKREEEKKKSKEEEEKKKNDVENNKKFEEAKKRNNERLENILKEKERKFQEIKTEEEKKIQKEKEIKQKRKELGLKQLKEKKNNPEKKEENLEKREENLEKKEHNEEKKEYDPEEKADDPEEKEDN